MPAISPVDRVLGAAAAGRRVAGTSSSRSTLQRLRAARSCRSAYGVPTSQHGDRPSARHVDLGLPVVAGEQRVGRGARRPGRSARPAPRRPGSARRPHDHDVRRCRCSGTRRSAGRTPASPGWCAAGPRVPGSLSVMPSAGAASASSSADAETSSVTSGRRSAGRSTRRPERAGRRRPVRGAVRRHSSGTRGRSTQRPSLASSAGSTVSEPSTATATTRIEPTASEEKIDVAGQEQPGHRDDHRDAGDDHRAAGGRRGDLDRVERARGPWRVPRAPAARRTASSRRRRPCRSAG